MTIDEAIKHCEEVAEEQERKAQCMGRQFVGTAMANYQNGCFECAADHRQLAEWLRELKERRTAKRGEWICNEELYYNGMAKCSCCEAEFYVEDLQALQGDAECVKFCPNCGADMIGDENG